MAHYVDLDYDKIVTQLLVTHRFFFLIEAGFFLVNFYTCQRLHGFVFFFLLLEFEI